MAERMLITKLVRTNGTRADLFGKGHQWPDIKLFDLSDLRTVGVDPATLELGQEVPCRFWAIYELSDKLNKAGNPYKDVIALEPMAKPATSTSTDSTALLAELRAIRGLLQALVDAQGLQVTTGDGLDDLDRAFPRYGDGSMVSENAAEQEAYQEHLEAVRQPPADVAALRAWVVARKNGNAE
jgi:hypothetical protein